MSRKSLDHDAGCARSVILQPVDPFAVARNQAPVDRLRRESPGGIGSSPSRVVAIRSYIRPSSSSLTEAWAGSWLRSVVSSGSDQVVKPLVRAGQTPGLGRLVAVLAQPAARADDQLVPGRADHRLFVFEILAEDDVMRPAHRAFPRAAARGRSPADPAEPASSSGAARSA